MENCRRFEIKKEKRERKRKCGLFIHSWWMKTARKAMFFFLSLSLSNTHWSRVTGCVIADGMKLSAAFNEDKGRLDD